MSTQTPGPWRLGLDGDFAHIFSADHKRSVIRLFTTDLRPGVTEENIANAHLIAASPDLLEALKAARKWMDDRRDLAEYVPEIAMALDAIAKAEGRS